MYVPDDDGITSEEAECLHGGRVEGADRVVIPCRLLNDESVRAGGTRSHEEK